MAPVLQAAGEAPYWDSSERNGWTYLLPPLCARRVLLVNADASRSLSLARLCQDAAMVWDERIPALRRPPDAESAGHCWHSVDELLAQQSLPFDAVILHDPEGRLLGVRAWPRVLQLLGHLRSAMPANAFIYVGMRQAWSPQRLAAWASARRERSSRGKVRHLLSIGRVTHDLRRAGFEHIEVHPYIMWGDTMAEVVPASGYRASKNRESRRERIKEMLLGPTGMHFLAPAYGVVAGSRALSPGMIELFGQRLDAAKLPTQHTDRSRPVLSQHLVFPGNKAIVAMGPPAEGGGVVGIFVGDDLALERRRAESSLLTGLAELPPPLARLIPKVLDQWSVGKTTVFVMNRLPGVSLDIAADVLDEVTRNALDFVIDLHRASAAPCAMDASAHAARIGVLLAAAAARNPPLAAELRSLDEPLQARLSGLNIPKVWQHGDYKVENVLYDQRTRVLTGVIDWELATRDGLPLLDPLYLIIYNRMIRGDNGLTALRDVLLERRLTAFEKSCIARYMRATGLAEAVWQPLCAVFIAHHIGHRIHLPADPALFDQLRVFITDMRAALVSSTVQPPAA
jgi:hypothetical protein